MKTSVLFIAALTAVGCSTTNPYDASGVFEATEIIISSEQSGRIIALNADEGTDLRAGEEFCTIDTIQLHLKKRQLEANLSASDARRLNIAEQIASLEQQLATAKRERARFAQLAINNAGTQKQVDDFDAQIAVLGKELTANRTSMENSNRSISDDSRALGVQIAQIDDQLRRCHVLSPIAATVLAKYTEKGEVTAPGKPIAKIATLDTMWLRAYITADELSRVKLGDTVSVISDVGDERRYTGRVSWISDKAEFTPKNVQTKDERANLVYATKIEVVNDGYIKIGMYGQARFGIKN